MNRVILFIAVGVIVIATSAYVLFGNSVTFFSDERQDEGGEVDLSEAITASLTVKFTLPEDKLGYDYWIYIDKRLVASRPLPKGDRAVLQEFQIELLPGEHLVEIASLDLSNTCFPISFQPATVNIEAGHSATVTFDLGMVGQCLAARGVPEGLNTDTWLIWLSQDIKKFGEWFAADPNAQALFDVHAALQQSPPMTGEVFINLHGSAGGGREFNATQVRILVNWLKEFYWSWFPKQCLVNNRYLDCEGVLPEAERQRYIQLSEIVRNHRETVIGQLNAIAEKLEEAEKLNSR